MFNSTTPEVELAFQNYFKSEEGMIQEENSSIKEKTFEFNPETMINKEEIDRYVANGNIKDIDEFGELIRKLLNAAWGSNWGEFTPEFSSGTDPEQTSSLTITYDIFSRESAENIGKPKPTLIGQYQEISNGTPTGDVIEVFSQFFDCIVEFNCWGPSTFEARKLLNRFEYVLSFYTGFIKEQGVQELLFLKEIPSKQSVHYIDGEHMKAMLYLIRLERKSFVRQSILKEVEIQVLEQKDKTTGNTPDNIYSNSNINYAF